MLWTEMLCMLCGFQYVGIYHAGEKRTAITNRFWIIYGPVYWHVRRSIYDCD